jgi:tRNA(Ile)-lysidine synthase
VSGGSDSVALLWLMKDLADEGRVDIAGVAHFNHQLRDVAPDDEAFCRALAARAGLEFRSGTADVRGRAKHDGVSIEDAARRERYAFLRDVAARAGATRIATGHTTDDQAETFLLKLARGAGLSGLGGIYPFRDGVIRPLLDVRRRDLRAFLASRGETWIEDETNADVSNPRNRVRHVLLPQFEAAFGDSVLDAIARAAALAAEDGAWLDAEASRLFSSMAGPSPGGIALAEAPLRALPAPLARRVLLQAMRAVAAGREVGSRHVEAAIDVLNGRCRSAETPAGHWEHIRGNLVLTSRAGAEVEPAPARRPKARVRTRTR